MIGQAADELLIRAELEDDEVKKIRLLTSMDKVVLKSIQKFFKEKVEDLKPSIEVYLDELSKELKIPIGKRDEWIAEIEKHFNSDVERMKDGQSINRLVSDLNRLKSQEVSSNTFDPYLLPERQNRIEHEKLKFKFPQKRIQPMLEFLGDLGKGSLLAQISSNMNVLSGSGYSREEREKAIIHIKQINDKDVVTDLKNLIVVKSKEFPAKRRHDIEKLESDHQAYLSNYAWLDRQTPIVQKSKEKLNSVLMPNIKDLQAQETLSTLLTYTENNLMIPEINLQKIYKEKKAEASQVYDEWLEGQIIDNLQEAFLPIYNELTKNAEPSKVKENSDVFQAFIQEKAKHTKTNMLKSKSAVVELQDLKKLAQALKPELKEKLESYDPIDYVWKILGW